MSIQAVGWVLQHETTTSGAERLVLISLANHAGLREGVWEAYPSIETIAAEAGIGRQRTVQTILARLVDRGLILRAINAAPDSRIRRDRRPNLYSLVCIPHGLTANGTPLTDGVTPGAPRGDTLRPDGVTLGVTQTIIEPSVEPNTARPDRFDDLWLAYPRKVGKPTARAAYLRAVKRGIPEETIIAGARLSAQQWKAANTEERFIPHPSTWLNRDGWNDRPPSSWRRPYRCERRAPSVTSTPAASSSAPPPEMTAPLRFPQASMNLWVTTLRAGQNERMEGHDLPVREDGRLDRVRIILDRLGHTGVHDHRGPDPCPVCGGVNPHPRPDRRPSKQRHLESVA